jgi:imidazolonepropionase-like amidohydrolase
MKHFRHIFAGWLVDGSGGPVRQKVLMGWEESTMVSVQEAEPQDIRKTSAEDLGTFTVLPGLVDAHVHLSLSGTVNPEERRKQVHATFDQAGVRIEGHILDHMRRGVVALRDGGDRQAHVLSYKNRLSRDTRLPVRLKAPGQAWHAPGRYGGLIGRTPQTGETLKAAVARGCAGADHIKIVNSGLNSLTRFGDETPPQFGLDALREAVREAHARGRKVMVHANGKVPVALAVEAGCDSIEHGFFMGKENLEKMAERGTVWVPTLFTMAAYAQNLGKDRVESKVAGRNLEHQLDQLRLAFGIGVPIATGTDSGSLGVHHGEALSEELRLLMTAGFPLEQAVRCASSRGAALLEVEDHTGVLAPGRPATFVAVKGRPESILDRLKAPDLVVVKGKGVRFDS